MSFQLYQLDFSGEDLIASQNSRKYLEMNDIRRAFFFVSFVTITLIEVVDFWHCVILSFLFTSQEHIYIYTFSDETDNIYIYHIYWAVKWGSPLLKYIKLSFEILLYEGLYDKISLLTQSNLKSLDLS